MTQPAFSILPEKNWDLCVVGGGIVAWTTAALALQKGRNVLLLEKAGRHGGRFSPEQRNGFALGSGLILGDTSAWKRIGEQLQLGMEWIKVENGAALAHAPKGWQATPSELPDWETFAACEVNEVPFGGIGAYLQKLKSFCANKGDAFYAALEAPVEELWVGPDGHVQKIVLGSGQELKSRDFIWTGSAKALLEIFRGEGAPEEGVARVAWFKNFVKTTNTPGVVLEFLHKQPVAEFTETLLLPFSSGEKEDRHYLVGSFLNQRDPSLAPQAKQLSTWVCSLSETEWDDNHETMKKIRAARRLLEKAFAGFEATLLDERVLVLEHTFTPVNKRKGQAKPILENLFLIADWAAPEGSHWQGVLQLLEEEHAFYTPHSG
jgi:phytoene dehydrogenase-like protein